VLTQKMERGHGDRAREVWRDVAPSLFSVSLTSRLPEYLQSGCRLWCGRIHVACSMPYRAGGLHPRLSIDLHWERLCGPVDYKQDTNEGYEVDL
jgi:hypothetical protein